MPRRIAEDRPAAPAAASAPAAAAAAVSAPGPALLTGLGRLINSRMVEQFLLVHVGQYLDAVTLSRAAATCRALRVAFNNETIWRRLCEDAGMKQEGRTRTRNFKFFRQIFVEQSCVECCEAGRVIFDIGFKKRGDCAQKVSLCATCTQTVRMCDSWAARRAAKVLPRVRRQRSEVFWAHLLDVIPTSKDIAKNKKLKDEIDCPFHNDSLIKSVANGPLKPKGKGKPKGVQAAGR